jgi:cell division protease FtsH
MRPFWIYIVLVIGAALVFHSVQLPDERIPYARFREMAAQRQFASVEIKGDAYVGRTVGDGKGAAEIVRTGRIEETEKDLLARLDESNVPYTRVADEHPMLPPLLWLVPILGGGILLALFLRRTPATNAINPALNFGKNKARLYVDKGEPVSFRDVAGSHEAKAELTEIVEFLRAPERFKRLGARVPKGVLLVGPPGTGKTLLARAVAGEANVPFYSICGSEFVEMFVGVGAARVRDLFVQAREKPAAIIFVDELDAVGKARGMAGPIGGNDEREQTLNQLLTEMDGFDGHAGLVIMAATNRPEILDPALLRAGRFDRRIMVDRPDLRERREILEVHSRRVLLGSDVDLGRVASLTAGLVGADLANMLNEGALLAARRNASAVAQADLDEAGERIVAGFERRGRRLGERERLVVAYHETGHALMAELLPTQDPVRKVSIIPRGFGALGYTLQQPSEDRYLFSRREIVDRLVVLLGGRVAEEETVGDVSTGAQDDLVKATDLARRMVRELGMGESVGVAAFEPRGTMSFLGERWGGSGGANEYSDATARAVDREVAKLLAEAKTRARSLMIQHRDMLERIARRLFDVETLTGEELRALMSAPCAAEAPEALKAS